MDETPCSSPQIVAKPRGFIQAVVIIKDLDIAKYIKFLESILNKKPLGIRMVLFFLAPTVAASSCGGVHHKR
jgi:hypothetical protein